MAGNAIRLSEDVIDDLRKEATTMTRSVTGQAEHWIKLGQAVERSTSFSYSRVQEALKGKTSEDALTEDEGHVFDQLFAESMWQESEHGQSDDDYYEQMKARDRSLGLDTSKLGD